LHIKILTIFPEMFDGPLTKSILKRAQEQELLTIECLNIRDFSTDKHYKVDDYPFGGGAGMVMQADPLVRCLESAGAGEGARVVMLSPRGSVFNQATAKRLAAVEDLILICGHYEGIDERVNNLVNEEISIGDFILTGGEIAAMALVDAVGRLIPGVVGDALSLEEESFNSGLLEYPQYTRPPLYGEWSVPEILLSGNHQAIARWRRAEAVKRTFFARPDLLAGVDWRTEDRETIDHIFQSEDDREV
jgi:tRNA (guanine37-N1)-methyltransferase